MSATPTRKRFPPLNASRKNSIWVLLYEELGLCKRRPLGVQFHVGNNRKRAAYPLSLPNRGGPLAGENGVTMGRGPGMRRITRPSPSPERPFGGFCESARTRPESRAS